MSKNHLPCTTLFVLLSISAVCGADEFHYNNILIGDRASGMGGAYTAVSDDPGGMYYNPAGIAYSTGKNLSASVNAYSVSNRTYKSAVGGQDWKRTSSTLLPNYFGIIQPVGKLKLGFSYAVPDSNQEDQDQLFTYSGSTETTVINFNNKNDTNLFGPSAALQLNDSFSIGATLYVHKRSTEAILNASNLYGAGSAAADLGNLASWANSYIETDEWGLKPILGVMWSPIEKVSLGVTVSKTIILTSDILKQETSTANNPARIYESYNYKREYPYQIAAGVACFPNSSLLLTGELSYYSSFDYTWVNGTEKRNAVLNGALGTEYFLNKNWAVRSGLFTDFSNTPSITEGYVNQREHIDMFGGSLTVSHFTKNTSLSCGGSYKFGSGKTQLFKDSVSIQNVDASNWTLFVSSSYSY
ncbi:MAG: outer membrane protein transport protein [Desulfuromonadaceae bacterium]|nr:outer membrane protein transport protein [Desulfuromonadaceae bacterium]